jgi:hypothetical protein
LWSSFFSPHLSPSFWLASSLSSSSGCPANCQTCSAASSSTCQICTNSNYLYSGLCVVQCALGYITSPYKPSERPTGRQCGGKLFCCTIAVCRLWSLRLTDDSPTHHHELMYVSLLTMTCVLCSVVWDPHEGWLLLLSLSVCQRGVLGPGLHVLRFAWSSQAHPVLH